MAKPDGSGRVRHVRTLDEELVDASSLEIRVGSFVRINAGSHKGLTGTVKKLSEDFAKVMLYLSEEVVSVRRSRLAIYNRATAMSSQSGSEKKKNKGTKRPRSISKIKWVRPRLRVRIVSKSLHGGKYYRKKARVEDVVSATHFTLVSFFLMDLLN